METWLPLVWFGVIAFAVLMYVLLDGFDLGIGILFPFAPDDDARDVMMHSVAPIWDGNETWLVLGGSGLLVAFPVVYATALPALYLPLLLMLIALVFRGVAFEFRFKAQRTRALWSTAFFAGSLCAAFAQGLIVGAVVEGIAVRGEVFIGGPFDWLTPFSLFTGVAVTCGYTLLGATWLYLKTEGLLQDWCRRLVRPLTAGLIGGVAVVSLWTPQLAPAIAVRWYTWPHVAWLAPLPLTTVVLAVWLWRAQRHGREYLPFLLALGLFLLSFLGLVVSLWPNILPPGLTVWEAAASPSTQAFMLVGVAILVPVILLYTGYSYYVFRGKVRVGEGYH